MAESQPTSAPRRPKWPVHPTKSELLLDAETLAASGCGKRCPYTETKKGRIVLCHDCNIALISLLTRAALR